MFAAIIFDFDGLIVDTELPIYLAWSEAYQSIDIPPLSVEEWSVGIGTVGVVDPLVELEARAAALGSPRGPPAVSRLAEACRRRQDELLAAETVRPGVVSCIDAASRRGLPIAV